MGTKYSETIDRESAYELLQRKVEERMAEEKEAEEKKQLEKEQKELEKQRLAEEKAAEKARKEEERRLLSEEREKAKAKANNPLNKVAKTTLNTVTGDIGRKIARGLLGGITKGLFK
jgi:hypothetical protein